VTLEDPNRPSSLGRKKDVLIARGGTTTSKLILAHFKMTCLEKKKTTHQVCESGRSKNAQKSKEKTMNAVPWAKKQALYIEMDYLTNLPRVPVSLGLWPKTLNPQEPTRKHGPKWSKPEKMGSRGVSSYW